MCLLQPLLNPGFSAKEPARFHIVRAHLSQMPETILNQFDDLIMVYSARRGDNQVLRPVAFADKTRQITTVEFLHA